MAPSVITVDWTAFRQTVEPLAFWMSVALPFVYLPLLLGGSGDGQLPFVLGLVALHALCLVLGHSHRA